MKKFPIGFCPETPTENGILPPVTPYPDPAPRKSVVQVYFPKRNISCSYYNDKFDLKAGDLVYVEGKLEGCRGCVTEVNYSFKIKLSDYKKVIAVVDTNIHGDFYLAGSHVITCDKFTLPYSKIRSWFKAPENEEDYASGDTAEFTFPLSNLSKMNISSVVAERGREYYIENRVVFLELCAGVGRAIVEGSEYYEIEFNFTEGEISNLKCSCYCTGACKHEFAAMLQLRETLDIISENYNDIYNSYFSAVSKDAFMSTVMSKKTSGKISIGD